MLFTLLLATLLADSGGVPTAHPCAEGCQPAQGLVVGLPTFADAVQMANEGRDAEALAAFQRLVSANPNDHQARLWIARLHERLDHPDLAEAVYRSVLLEDPENLEAMLGVASLLIAREEPAEALEVLQRAEPLAPQSDAVLAALGRAHRLAGRTDVAILYFDRAVAVAPIQQHRLSLEDARRSYLHRVEMRGFSEQFSGSTPDSHSGDLSVNVRLNDELRVFGRAQVQRKFRFSEERGGGGAEWRWKRTATLRGHAIVGPNTRVMPEGDYLGEIDYTYQRATWTASWRYFDFTGAWVNVVSPSVTWLASDRWQFGLRYALTTSESNTFTLRQTGHSLHLRGARRFDRRLWVLGGYAAGVEDFENFSIDRIGDFRANTLSGGVRYDLPTLTSLVGMYEHQWRRGNIDMGRITIFLAHRF